VLPLQNLDKRSLNKTSRGRRQIRPNKYIGEREMKTPHNAKIVTLKLKRIDVCDLLLATTALKHETKAEKWERLHDKLTQILEDFDAKNFDD
jgi:hypothetical protein